MVKISQQSWLWYKEINVDGQWSPVLKSNLYDQPINLYFYSTNPR